MQLEFGDFAADEVTVGHETLRVAAGLDVVRPGRELLVGERGLDHDGHHVRVLVVIALVIVEGFLRRGLAAARGAHEVAGHFATARFKVLLHVVDAVGDITAVLQMAADEPVLVQHDRPRFDVNRSAAPLSEQPRDRRCGGTGQSQGVQSRLVGHDAVVASTVTR